MRVLRRRVQRRPVRVEQPEPAAVLAVPHALAKETEAVERDLRPAVVRRERDAQYRGHTGLPGLELEHAALRAEGPPATVEVAKKASTLAVDAARKPDVGHVAAKIRRERGGQQIPFGLRKRWRSRLGQSGLGASWIRHVR